MRILLLASACLLASAPAAAQPQAPAPVPVDTTQAGAVKVFVDCQSPRCDFDFFRDQMRWVNFVRDRLVSDVLLLVTSLRTGGGGTEYTIAALGQGARRGRADTAVVVAAPNDADDVVRRNLARSFALLLAPYAARSPLASRLDLTYRAPSTAPATPKTVRDRWNFWVYRLGASGYGSGEKQQQFFNGSFSLSASRTTALWKASLGANLGYNESRFSLASGGTFTNILRENSFNSLLARGLGDHWSAGVTATASTSDYSNYRLNLAVTPGVEWNLFPYREFTRRQLTLLYSAGVAAYRYKATTIYGRNEETRPRHALTASWNTRQPWGSVNWSVFGNQFLHDTRYYSYGTSTSLDLRIAKGLSLNLGGSFSRVNDQLYLPRGTLTDNQVIARQQALATNYRYFVSAGFSYTFGSIYNTVVNPRFGGTRGGSQMIMMF